MDPDHAEGFGGVINDYYLVRTAGFPPRGSFCADRLRKENVTGFRWWCLPELRAYRGTAEFAPRPLPALLADLLTAGVPGQPLAVGVCPCDGLMPIHPPASVVSAAGLYPWPVIALRWGRYATWV